MGIRPNIDRRPKAYCFGCWTFFGTDESVRFCPYCGNSVTNNTVNYVQLCQDNRLLHGAILKVVGATCALLLCVIGLGFTIMKLQHYTTVDTAYGLSVLLVLAWAWWYVRTRVKPSHKSIYRNPYFITGTPEDAPKQRRVMGKQT